MKLFLSILRLSGIACLLIAVIGFILGLFDYVLVIRGAELPIVDGGTAIGLAIGGIILFVIGHFLLKRSEKKDPGPAIPQLDLNNLQFIEKAIRRTVRRNLIISISMIAFAALFICVPFLDPEANPSSGGSIFIYCLAGLMIFLGVFMIAKAMKMMNVQDSDIYKAIMLEPKTITGLDALIIRNAYTKHGNQINASLFISTKKIATLTVNESELELLRQYLVKHNPNLQYSQNAQVVS